MAYIGKSPTGTGVRQRYYFTATGGETSLSGTDDNGLTLSYSDGAYVDVPLNGIELVAGTDYNTSTANTIAGLSALAANDIVTVTVYDIFTVADTVSAKDGGTFNGNVNFSDNTKAQFGNGNDLQIYHNGSNSLIHDTGTGNLQLIANNIDVLSSTFENIAKFNEDSDVKLYYDNSIKLSTTSAGVNVTGDLGIGTSSSSRKFALHNSGANSVFAQWTNGTTGEAGSNGYLIGLDGSGNIEHYNYESTDIKIYTAGTERMRIGSSGGVLLGNDFSHSFAGGELSIYSTNNYTITSEKSSTGAASHIRFRNPNGTVGDIRTSGSSTSYNTSSDHRLKENDVDMTGAISRVKQLQPKRFNFIADETDTLVDGFMAHEVQTVVPEAITGTHNEVDDDGNPVYQGIDQSKLVPLLTGALQEAIAKIETLEAKVTALENA